MEWLMSAYDWLAAAPIFVQIPVGLLLFIGIVQIGRFYAYIDRYDRHRS